MSDMTIDQMNEVIALFMGFEKYEDKYGIWFKREGMIKCLHPKLQSLQYHSSWDALMPVVKKIKSMHFDLRNQAPIFAYMEAAAPMNSGLIQIDLKKLHNGVYTFLLWYQKQQSNEQTK